MNTLRIAEQLDAVPENGADPDLIQEAAAELRRLHALNQELLDVLKAVGPFIVTQPVGCHGDRCREPWCWSCYDNDEAESAAQQGATAAAKARAAIAKAEG